MASGFPGSLDNFATNKADATATATDHAGHHNDLADAVNKVEAELGTDPSNGYATVKARFAAIPHSLSLTGDATPVVGQTFAAAASGLNITLANAVPVRFQYMILWQPNAATTGAKFALSSSATVSALVYQVGYNTTADVWTWSTVFGDSNDAATAAGTASNNSAANLAIINGIVVPTGAGTLSLRSAAEVASPGAVTVKTGSSVLFW
jgi:hypothetical protein